MRSKIIILGLALLSYWLAPFAQAGTLAIYARGSQTVAIPAGQYINVFSQGPSTAQVFKQVGYPNMVPRYILETGGNVTGQEAIFGPYTNATNVRIFAGVDAVLYSVGTGAVPIPCSRAQPGVLAQYMPNPIAQTAAITLLATDLMNGLITGTHTDGSTISYTLPTGTLLDAAASLAVNTGFRWTLINLSAAAADTITVAAGSGHTIVGTAVVASAHATTGALYGNAATFFTRKTATNTFVTYRLD